MHCTVLAMQIRRIHNGNTLTCSYCYISICAPLQCCQLFQFTLATPFPYNQIHICIYYQNYFYINRYMYIVVYYFFLKLQVISVALCSFPIAFDFWVIICIRYHEYSYTKQQKVTHREFVTRSCWVTLMPDGLLFIQIKTELHFQEKNQLTIFLQIDGNFVMW